MNEYNELITFSQIIFMNTTTLDLTKEISELEAIKNESKEVSDELSKFYALETRKRELHKEEDAKKLEILNKIKETPYYTAFVDFFENSFEASYHFLALDKEDSYREIHEDDGTLHITFGKIRGCFISNQEIERADWNKRANVVLTELKTLFPEYAGMKL